MQDPRVHITKAELEGTPVPETPVDVGLSLIVKDEEVEFIQQYFKDVTPLSTMPKFESFNRATRRRMIKHSKSNLSKLK
jgi:hypothetical protein